jgi:hypothetical protein
MEKEKGKFLKKYYHHRILSPQSYNEVPPDQRKRKTCTAGEHFVAAKSTKSCKGGFFTKTEDLKQHLTGNSGIVHEAYRMTPHNIVQGFTYVLYPNAKLAPNASAQMPL